MQHMTKHCVSIEHNIRTAQELIRCFHLVTHIPCSHICKAFVVAGLLMVQATWQQLLMPWKQLKKKSLSQTGCESISLLPCDAMQSAVMPQYIVCLSVCLSVRDV